MGAKHYMNQSTVYRTACVCNIGLLSNQQLGRKPLASCYRYTRDHGAIVTAQHALIKVYSEVVWGGGGREASRNIVICSRWLGFLSQGSLFHLETCVACILGLLAFFLHSSSSPQVPNIVNKKPWRSTKILRWPLREVSERNKRRPRP